MNRRIIPALAAFLGIGMALTSTAFIHTATDGNKDVLKKETGNGFAVVELFTSEGCSSCPPADELIAKIQKESEGKRIYIVSFHVDYWDRLGWKDAFSKSAFTQRQDQYAGWMHLSSIYTPQVVVNGNKEFVGSQEKTLRDAIRSGLQKTRTATVTLKKIRADQQQLEIEYNTGQPAKGTSLLLALVQKTGQTRVLKGENQGRTLSHVQIARDLRIIQLRKQPAGKISFSLPAGVTPDNTEVIGMIQKDADGEIIAAVKMAADGRNE